MVENAFEYIEFLVQGGLQRNSARSYRRYLESVSKYLKIHINRETVSSNKKVSAILEQLSGKYYADSYVKNCGTALRKYLSFVESTVSSFTFAEELPEGALYIEGAAKTIVVNKYERDIKARNAAIAEHGLHCFVCNFNFEEVYGDIGAGYIHVHHVVPLHTIKKEYVVNPEEDLVPVCPNCHAMIHRTKPCLTIKQLQALMQESKD